VALTPVVLIHGSEAALSDRALNEALSLRKDFERTTLDGSELELGRFSEVIAPSLFSERRVVVIRDLQDVIGEVACEPLKKQSEKEGFVREEFARHGRKISPAAVVALVNATGSDTRELAAACSQIAFDTNAGKAQIDEGDIANYYQGRVEATGFDVADAVVAGDVKGTLITLRQALDTGTDPVMIISAVANSVRAIAKVSDVPRNAKSFELAGTLGLAPWQIDKARRQLTRWRPGMITFAINELARADYGVKGGEADPIYALERSMVAIAKNIASGGSV